MDKQFFIKNRQRYLDSINENSVTVLFSGRIYPDTADENFDFSVNRNFYYLTGIRQANVVLVLVKGINGIKQYLLVEENDPELVRWVGAKLYKEEAQAISGIDNVLYLDQFDDLMFGLLNSSRKSYDDIRYIYLDLERRDDIDIDYQGIEYAEEFHHDYPEIKIENAYNKIVRLRMDKSVEEVNLMKESIETTKGALENVMTNIKPGLYEYQVETYFDSYIKWHGQKPTSFKTIMASGMNGTTLHYSSNNNIIKDNELVLMDLGCCTDLYISDITRTYPANGKFTPRQRDVYNAVLNCNKKCIEYLKPGMTWGEYNDYANKLLIQSLKDLGKITKDEELNKYYWHSIGHSAGLDTHDPDIRNVKFFPGMVMTCEPGLYLGDEGIGVRIEDDVMITEDGAVCLSKDIIKEADDIEKFMAEHNKNVK